MSTISSMALLTKDLLDDAKQVANSHGHAGRRVDKVVKKNRPSKEFKALAFERKVDLFDDNGLIDFMINLKSPVKIKTAIEQRKNSWTPRELSGFVDLYSSRYQSASLC